MLENVNANKLKDLHKVGLQGVLDIVIKHKTFQKLPFVISIIASLLFIGFLATLRPSKFFEILQLTSDLITTVFPGLLGFSLGGYAIAVGFSNNDLIKYSTNTQKHNIYQILSGIFALSILFQAIATIVSFIITWSIKVNFNSLFDISFPSIVTYFINGFFILILFVSSLYSLLLTPYIVTNLFTLSQLNSLHFTLEKIKEKSK